jgi:hypothetical protein
MESFVTNLGASRKALAFSTHMEPPPTHIT